MPPSQRNRRGSIARAGKPASAPASGVFLRPVFAPDQNRIVGERLDGGAGDIWILDVTRGTGSRFTLIRNPTRSPSLHPTAAGRLCVEPGRNLRGVYQARDGRRRGATRAHGARHKPPASPTGHPTDERFSITRPTRTPRLTCGPFPLAGDRKPYPILNQNPGAAIEIFSRRPLAVLPSTETGREEIYVQSFPPSGGKWQVSVNGGNYAYWRRDGREIIFDAPDRKIMAVDVKLGATFEAGIPRPLFDCRPLSSEGVWA